MTKKHILTGLRYFFSFLLFTTAIGKLLDNRGFSEVINTYQLVPNSISLYLGLAVSLVELILGFFILKNKFLVNCAVLTIFIHIGYVLLAVITLARGLNLQNCGCFGVFLARPMTLQTVFEDLFLLALAVLFYKLALTTKGVSYEK